ncbi:sugar ABC transporter permease [Nakamurella flava]|uniref:Sugar ABC transporter permease n=1 Tax=Nakamurella flava TaxID=2576308 RepID=A0A4U6QPF0_9ACTN|nr:sugar ABC transporter permease [Nakamurella flava]
MPAGPREKVDQRPNTRAAAHTGVPSERRREALAAWVFLAPTILLLGLFVLIPLGGAVVLSFQRTNGFGDGTFIGLDNYTRLLGDPVFWRALINTIVFTVLVTPGAMALGLGAALLLNSALPARPAFRSALILPMAVSGVATALIGLLMFDENTGLIDALLRTLGLPDIDWQSNPTAAFASIVLVTLWWRVGFNMLVYLAALQGIDGTLIEAARTDGASGGQLLRYVTIPLLGAPTFFLLVVNVIYSFQVFDIVFVLTGGGPQNATTVLVTYAYDTGFVSRDQGYAAAIGMVLLLFSLFVTAVQWRTNRGRDVAG